jgi:hypothetical protein
VSHAADLCPQCLAANIIATRNGPTCTHQLNSGVLWWPAWWQDGSTEAKRLAWLAERAKA